MGNHMRDVIPRGSREFESLLADAGLTNREADSVRAAAVGMRVDQASALLASNQYCPVFVVEPNSGPVAKVLDMEVHDGEVYTNEEACQYAWAWGSTATYYPSGSWKGYVLLRVAS